jgi:hypothetical protein
MGNNNGGTGLASVSVTGNNEHYLLHRNESFHEIKYIIFYVKPILYTPISYYVFNFQIRYISNRYTNYKVAF